MCHESRCNTAHTSIIFSLSETQRPFLSFFLVFSFFFLFLDFIFLTLSTSFPSQTIPIMMAEVLLCSSAVLFHHYVKFSLVETGWSPLKKNYCTQYCSPSIGISVWQHPLSLLFVFTWGNLYTQVFSAAEDLGSRWRLWGIFQLLKKVHFLFAAKHSCFFGMNVCSSSLSCFPIFAKSHKHQFSKAYGLRTVVRHRLEGERVISCFFFWGFQDVAVKVNEKNFSDSGEISLSSWRTHKYHWEFCTKIWEGLQPSLFSLKPRMNISTLSLIKELCSGNDYSFQGQRLLEVIFKLN